MDLSTFSLDRGVHDTDGNPGQILGTSKWISNFTGYGSNPRYQYGNYLVLKVQNLGEHTISAETYWYETRSIDPIDPNDVKIDGDHIVIRLNQDQEASPQCIRITLYLDGIIKDIFRFRLNNIDLIENTKSVNYFEFSAPANIDDVAFGKRISELQTNTIVSDNSMIQATLNRITDWPELNISNEATWALVLDVFEDKAKTATDYGWVVITKEDTSYSAEIPKYILFKDGHTCRWLLLFKRREVATLNTMIYSRYSASGKETVQISYDISFTFTPEAETITANIMPLNRDDTLFGGKAKYAGEFSNVDDRITGIAYSVASSNSPFPEAKNKSYSYIPFKVNTNTNFFPKYQATIRADYYGELSVEIDSNGNGLITTSWFDGHISLKLYLFYDGQRIQVEYTFGDIKQQAALCPEAFKMVLSDPEMQYAEYKASQLTERFSVEYDEMPRYDYPWVGRIDGETKYPIKNFTYISTSIARKRSSFLAFTFVKDEDIVFSTQYHNSNTEAYMGYKVDYETGQAIQQISTSLSIVFPEDGSPFKIDPTSSNFYWILDINYGGRIFTLTIYLRDIYILPPSPTS